MSADQMYQGLQKIIASVISNRDSWPFKEPVDEQYAPLYYQVIRNPIDLSVIEKKIDDRLYVNFIEVEKDFKLLVNNCETYNGPGNGFTLLSYAVWRVFKRSVKRFLNANLSYNEQVAFVYPPNRKNRPPRAAIEARKKKRRHRKLKALETLARAAEEAVKYTTIRGVSQNLYTNLSPKSSPSSSSSSSSKDSRDSSGSHNNVSTPEHGLSDAESNSVPHHILSNANLNIGLSEENLTFKSLSEWCDYIREHGEIVKLPHDSVIFSANISTNSKMGEPHSKLCEERHTKSLSLDRYVIDSVNNNSQTPKQAKQNEDNYDDVDDDDSQQDWSSSSCKDSCKSSPNCESKRLVLKLSRCDGPTWKAIKLAADADNNSANDSFAKESPNKTTTYPANASRKHLNLEAKIANICAQKKIYYNFSPNLSNLNSILKQSPHKMDIDSTHCNSK